MMDHPEVMYFVCDECDIHLSRHEVEEGKCVECGGRFTAVPVFRDPQPARLSDAD